MAIYVDNTALLGATGELNEHTIDVLKTEFEVNDMGAVNSTILSIWDILKMGREGVMP